MIWVYRSVADVAAGKPRRAWEVGYYHPVHQGAGKWEGTTQYDEEAEAMRTVNYLNGGQGYPVPWLPVKIEELE